MRLYELVLVLRTSLSEAQRKKIVDGVKEVVKDLKVLKEEEWGQKPLAYQIKREVAGFFHSMQLEGEAFPKGFENRIVKNEDILRHLLLRKK